MVDAIGTGTGAAPGTVSGVVAPKAPVSTQGTGKPATGAVDIAHTDGKDAVSVAGKSYVQYDPRTNVVDINTRTFKAVRDTGENDGERTNKAIVDSKGNIIGYGDSATTENLTWTSSKPTTP